ncbi:isopeptide-forming domain-containing protein [Bifidobacterium xylocopae]|uniref:Cell surface protein n=1 Tax=Bifidobacterium xylocopae TaxID=2493119 RepID=A0A366KCV5_9BIFI|nr:hypothetical protein [Bifidobacterium xylocopae]RBP99197.1 hypothetical protein CRD59_04745 [Bifidobacterium xylocopae]
MRVRQVVARLSAVVVCAAMALLTVWPAQADTTSSTYDSADDFVAGINPDPGKKPNLSLFKRLTQMDGHKATGSHQDSFKALMAPGIGVEFTLTEIRPTGKISDMQATPPSGFSTVPGMVYKGTTDSKGAIQVGTGTGPGVWTKDGAAAEFPAGVHYYLLHESGTPYSGSDYAAAKDSIFGLPYSARNTTKTTDASGRVTSTTSVEGFVYNLHLFPKNMTENQLTKRAVEVKDAGGRVRSDLVAQAGDTVTWEINQRFYDGNTGGGLNRDGKLDMKELDACPISGGHTDCYELADRLPSSLAYAQGSSSVVASWEEEDGKLHTTDLGRCEQNWQNVAGAWVGSGGLPLPLAPGSPTDGPMAASPPRWPMYNQAPHKSLLMYDSWSAGTTFLQYRWVRDDLVAAFRPDLPGRHLNMKVTIRYNTVVTGLGDSEAAPTGELLNTVSADHVDNTSVAGGAIAARPVIRAQAWVLTAGFQFAKTSRNGDTGLSGAVFRLAKPGDGNLHLASDGRFHAAGSPLPNGVSWIQATSNKTSDESSGLPGLQSGPTSQGIVTFTGIPVLGADGKVKPAGDLRYDLVEVTAPRDRNGTVYRFSSRPFSSVDLGEYAGRTPEAIVQGRTRLAANMGRLVFGEFEANLSNAPAGSYQDLNGDPVTRGVVNWKPDESAPERVGSLPLTGGIGIALMLLAGTTIMAVIGYQAHRRLIWDGLPYGHHRAA